MHKVIVFGLIVTVLAIPEPQALTTRIRPVVNPIAAMERLPIDLPDEWEVRFRYDKSYPGAAGMANPSTLTITIWPERNGSTEQTWVALLHEIGHAYDLAKLNDIDRIVWMSIRGLKVYDYEDFAESFGYCFHGRSDWIRYEHVEPATEFQCETMMGMIR